MGVPITEPSNVRSPNLVLENDSLHQKRQISVDPTSLKDSVFKDHPSLKLPHLKPGKFLSNSLPNSANSSPRFSSPLKKKWKNQPSSPMKMIDPTTGQQSLALSRLAQLQENHFQRSKSCGEGRNTSPSADLEMCTRKIDTRYNIDHVDSNKSIREVAYHEKFKCGACLFLPGFGKAKQVMSRRIHEEENIKDDNVIEMEIMRRQRSNEKQVMMNLISNRVSLEKFECGSWTSSAIVMDHEDDGIVDAGGLLVDLPTEDNRDINESTANFVLDGDLKGVLKKVVVRPGMSGSNGNNRKSVEPGSRHVRFSDVTSKSNPASPKILCISPQLRKARDDFNAFLEAQTA